jgi:protein subunit release factor A
MVGFRCFISALAKESRAESVLARVIIQKFKKVQESSRKFKKVQKSSKKFKKVQKSSKKFKKVQKSSKKFKKVQSSKKFKALFKLGSTIVAQYSHTPPSQTAMLFCWL